MDDLEQYGRRENIRIHNVAESYNEADDGIGAGSRGQGGQLPPPWRYFGPLWTTFAPLRLVSWAIFGTKNATKPAKTFFYVFGSKRHSKFFFSENACFWDKKMLQIRRRPFFIILENACFSDKEQSNFSEEPYFAF